MNPFLRAGLIALALQASPVAAVGDERQPTIQELSVAVDDGRALVDVEATGTLDTQSLERLQSGLPVTIEYQFEIRNRRRAWFDKARGSASVAVETVYDAVTREYTVTRRLNGEPFDVRSTRSLDGLEPLLSRLDDFPVLQVSGTDLGEDPEMRCRLVTRRRTWLWLIPRPLASDWQQAPLGLGPGPAADDDST